MRKSLIILASLFLATSVHAQDKAQPEAQSERAQSEKAQSYVSYSQGENVVIQGEDGSQVDARVNLPVFPGDELRTEPHGRSEIRLADGNTLSLNRDTSIRFQSILNSYEGADESTIAELLYGQVVIDRNADNSVAMRLDTQTASYVADADAIYSIEKSEKGNDLVEVFGGAVEVRTPNRTARLRSGERATVDADGPYAVANVSRYSMSDFEEWALRRAEKSDGSSRYLDSHLSYADQDLDDNGQWVYVSDFASWCWRPHVNVGWRPYYYGSWVYSPFGTLNWVSDESWGWVPYHFGRWAFNNGFGWVWLPGTGYSPAWVYWAFGPDYIGWAPAGWYDCWGPYYGWAFRPFVHARFDRGSGFFGRMHFGHDIDLRPWTFMNPTGIGAHGRERGILTADQVRDRLSRNGDATITSGGVRFDRNEMRDPNAAVRNLSRRGFGVSGTGKEGSGATADLTPFFRRDPQLSPTVRNHIVRPVSGAPAGGTGVVDRGGSRTTEGHIPRDGSNRPATGTSTSVPRDGVSRPGSSTPRDGTSRPGTSVPRDGATHASPPTPAPPPSHGTSDWRSNDRSPGDRQHADSSRTDTGRFDSGRSDSGRGDDWRRGPSRSNDSFTDRRGSSSISPRDIPRHVIDQIGGPRVTPADHGDFRDSRGSQRSEPSHASSGSGSHSSSGSGSHSSGSSSHSSSGSSSHSSGSSSSSSGSHSNKH